MCHSKEIVGTAEWQRLDPQDSIPTGLHVRIDMETGERWAKIAVADDNDLISTVSQQSEFRQNPNGAGAGAGASSVSVGADASQQPAVSQALIISSTQDNFDYDLMYRTYDRIPAEHRPLLPDKKSLSIEEWKKQMRSLWDDRQKQIKDAMHTIADVPEIMKKRIEEMTALLSFDSKVPVTERNAALDVCLSELEYLLTDIDAARDFYVLKGWPLLFHVLLDPTVPDFTRSLSALAVGNAVKNQFEFTPWSLDLIRARQHPLSTAAPQPPFTAVSALLSVLDRPHLSPDGGASSSKHPSNGDASVALTTKSLYALSSVLRGNEAAQGLFVDKGGGKVLRRLLHTYGFDHKLLSRLLSLSSDVVQELDLKQQQGEGGAQQPNAGAVRAEFSGPDWCTGAARLLACQVPTLEEEALSSLKGLLPHCGWKGTVEFTKLGSKLKAVENRWSTMVQSGELDEGWYNELKQLAQEVRSMGK